jgi:hypothetical protein
MSMVSGVLKGTAVFVVGMHLIGAGLVMNGGNRQTNIAWQIVSAFYAFEVGVLKVLLVVAIVVAVIFVSHLMRDKTANSETSGEFETSNPQRQNGEAQIKTSTPLEARVSAEQVVDTQPTPNECSRPEPPKILSTPKPEVSVEPQPSAEELRKKVLRELTGRS